MQLNRQNPNRRAASSRESTKRQRIRERSLMKKIKLLLKLHPTYHTELTLLSIASSIRLLIRSTYKHENHSSCSPMLHAPQTMQGLASNPASISPQTSHKISGDLSCTAGDHILQTAGDPVMLPRETPFSAAAPILQPAFSCMSAATSVSAICPLAAVSAMPSAPYGSVCTSEQYLVQREHVRTHLLPIVQRCHSEQTQLAALPRLPLASSVWHASPPLAVNSLPLLVACQQSTAQLAHVSQVPPTALSPMLPAPALSAEQHTSPPLTEQPPIAVAAVQSKGTQKQCLAQPHRSLRHEVKHEKKIEAAECLIMMSCVGQQEPAQELAC